MIRMLIPSLDVSDETKDLHIKKYLLAVRQTSSKKKQKASNVFATINDMEKQKERISRFGPKKEEQQKNHYEKAW